MVALALGVWSTERREAHRRRKQISLRDGVGTAQPLHRTASVVASRNLLAERGTCLDTTRHKHAPHTWYRRALSSQNLPEETFAAKMRRLLACMHSVDTMGPENTVVYPQNKRMAGHPPYPWACDRCNAVPPSPRGGYSLRRPASRHPRRC